MTEPSRALRQLARLHDIQTTYTDIRGKVTQASAEGLVRVLAHLGAPMSRPEDSVAGPRFPIADKPIGANVRARLD